MNRLMTDDEVILKKCPLCINIRRMSSYILSADEIILFDWLTIKQSLVFKYKQFFYPLKQIEEETKLKRRRIERIIKNFCAMGFLQVVTRQKSESLGRVRYFRMNFQEVIERLPEIINQESEIATEFNRYFKALANKQIKADKGKESNREREYREHAEYLYNALNDTYWDRIDMYNDGRLTYEVPDRLKVKTQLAKDRTTITKLTALSAKYNDDTICRSFIALCDDFLKGTKSSRKVENLLKYFLTYRPDEDVFSVVNLYITKFQKNYSKSR